MLGFRIVDKILNAIVPYRKKYLDGQVAHEKIVSKQASRLIDKDKTIRSQADLINKLTDENLEFRQWADRLRESGIVEMKRYCFNGMQPQITIPYYINLDKVTYNTLYVNSKRFVLEFSIANEIWIGGDKEIIRNFVEHEIMKALTFSGKKESLTK